MMITGHRVLGEILEFEGRVRGKADEALQKIRETFAAEPVSPMLLEGEENQARVLLVPGGKAKVEAVERPNWGLHWLFVHRPEAISTGGQKMKGELCHIIIQVLVMR